MILNLTNGKTYEIADEVLQERLEMLREMVSILETELGQNG